VRLRVSEDASESEMRVSEDEGVSEDEDVSVGACVCCVSEIEGVMVRVSELKV